MWVWVAVKDMEFLIHIHHIYSYSLFMFNRRMRFDVSPTRRYDINIVSDTLKPSLLPLRHCCYKWAGGACLRAAARGCTRSTAPRSRRTGRPTSPSSWTWAQTCQRCLTRPLGSRQCSGSEEASSSNIAHRSACGPAPARSGRRGGRGCRGSTQTRTPGGGGHGDWQM